MSAANRKGRTLPEHSICITMEGSDAEGGHVRAGDFARTVERVIRMLSRLDHRTATGGRKNSFYLRVVDLSHHSPARIVMEQVLIDPKTDRRKEVAERFFEAMQAIEAEEPVPPMDYSFLDTAIELLAPVGKTMKNLSVSANGTQQLVGPSFRECLAKKLKPEETSYGSIRGMLEYVNIHGKRPVFKIYPDVGPDQLSCRFDPSMLTEAREGLGKFVEVRGDLRYKVVAQYPYAIDVKEIEVMPGFGAPDWIGARGMFPDLTGELTTEQYIASARGSDAE